MESSWGSLWCWGQGSNLSRRYHGGGSLWKGQVAFRVFWLLPDLDPISPIRLPEGLLLSDYYSLLLQCPALLTAPKGWKPIACSASKPLLSKSQQRLYLTSETCLQSCWMTAREPWTCPERSASKPGEGDGQDYCAAARRWRGAPALHGKKGVQTGERKGRCEGREGAVGTAQGKACSDGAACLLLAGMPAICPD